MGKANTRNIVGYEMVRDGIATVAEVAELLGTSRQRVQHWCRNGFNPGRYEYREYKGGRYRATNERVEAFDAKATRKEWLSAEFDARLAVAPDYDAERVTTHNARKMTDKFIAQEMGHRKPTKRRKRAR